jgi:hypothetical protein
MTIRGRVKGGVVIIEDGAHLPEGQEVTIVAPDASGVTAPSESPARHRVLDIPPVSLGRVLRPLTANDDLLGEMLEDRP